MFGVSSGIRSCAFRSRSIHPHDVSQCRVVNSRLVFFADSRLLLSNSSADIFVGFSDFGWRDSIRIMTVDCQSTWIAEAILGNASSILK